MPSPHLFRNACALCAITSSVAYVAPIPQRHAALTQPFARCAVAPPTMIATLEAPDTSTLVQDWWVAFEACEEEWPNDGRAQASMMRFWRPDNAHKLEAWVRRNGRPGWKGMTWQELESYYSDDEKLIDRLGNRARAIQQRRYEQENPSILPWLIVAWGGSYLL